MAKRVCAAVKHYDEHTAALLRPILDYTDEVFYLPIIDTLEDWEHRLTRRRANAIASSLTAAIAAGAIVYQDGVFTGQFNAAISRELRAFGAKFSKAGRSFKIEPASLPIEIRQAIAVSTIKSRELHLELAALILLIAANVGQAETDINTTAAAMIIDRDIVEQLGKTVPANVVVPNVKLSIADLADLKANVDEAIKKSVATSARDLAEAITQNELEGANLHKLREIINVHLERLQTRAKSIAERETALFIAKERERLYKSIGVESYIWQTRLDERVRADHRILEGHQFTWDSPPVANRATGDRYNPGCGPNCRCAPLPIISTPND